MCSIWAVVIVNRRPKRASGRKTLYLLRVGFSQVACKDGLIHGDDRGGGHTGRGVEERRRVGSDQPRCDRGELPCPHVEALQISTGSSVLPDLLRQGKERQGPQGCDRQGVLPWRWREGV